MTGASPPGARVLIVGSGPNGATYARTLIEELPDVSVLMVDSGPVLTRPPGMNVKNIADPRRQAQARAASQGGANEEAGITAIPGGMAAEGTITARQGTHLVGQAAPGSAGLPAAAVSTCVGGQGAHWTCATPSPVGSERITFINPDEWERHVQDAEQLLHVTHQAFSTSPRATAILERVRSEFSGDGITVRPLPVAADLTGDGSLRWVGTDVVLGELANPEHSSRFELRAETQCVRLIREGDLVVGGVLRDLRTGAEERVHADAVVVAADAFHTPQLLWASGIRPDALGRYLTEHPLLFGVVAVRDTVLPAGPPSGPASDSDPIRGAVSVVFQDGAHPFHAQMMYTSTCPKRLEPDDPFYNNPHGYVTVGYGLRKFPRAEDRVTFNEGDPDQAGLPGIEIAYSLTESEEADIELARRFQTRAASVLGDFVEGTRQVMPAGTSLHFMGTYRMGPTDDGTCVCDSFSRVWGIDNLVLAGNGLIPTANACNPTLTSVALSIRGAAALAKTLAASATTTARAGIRPKETDTDWRTA